MGERRLDVNLNAVYIFRITWFGKSLSVLNAVCTCVCIYIYYIYFVGGVGG